MTCYAEFQMYPDLEDEVFVCTIEFVDDEDGYTSEVAHACFSDPVAAVQWYVEESPELVRKTVEELAEDEAKCLRSIGE